MQGIHSVDGDDAGLLILYAKLKVLYDELLALSTASPNAVKQSGPVTALDRYTQLCASQQVGPVTLFSEWLQRCGETPPPQPAEASTVSAPSSSVGSGPSVLDLTRAFIGRRALLPILLVLPECVQLQHLSLRDQHLNSVHVALLCNALLPLPKLTTLDLSFNPFGSEGVSAILRLVLQKPTLQQCELRGVIAVSPLLRRLEEALQRNQSALSNTIAADCSPDKEVSTDVNPS